MLGCTKLDDKTLIKTKKKVEGFSDSSNSLADTIKRYRKCCSMSNHTHSTSRTKLNDNSHRRSKSSSPKQKFQHLHECNAPHLSTHKGKRTRPMMMRQTTLNFRKVKRHKATMIKIDKRSTGTLTSKSAWPTLRKFHSIDKVFV